MSPPICRERFINDFDISNQDKMSLKLIIDKSGKIRLKTPLPDHMKDSELFLYLPMSKQLKQQAILLTSAEFHAFVEGVKSNAPENAGLDFCLDMIHANTHRVRITRRNYVSRQIPNHPNHNSCDKRHYNIIIKSMASYL